LKRSFAFWLMLVAFVFLSGKAAVAGNFVGQEAQIFSTDEQVILNAIYGGQAITGLKAPTYVYQSDPYKSPVPVRQIPCAAPAPQAARPSLLIPPAPPVKTADLPPIAKGLTILALEVPIKEPREINGVTWYPDKPPWFVMYKDKDGKDGKQVDRQGKPSKLTEVWDHRPEGSKLLKVDGPIFPKG
jgi:hypothetical protein